MPRTACLNRRSVVTFGQSSDATRERSGTGESEVTICNDDERKLRDLIGRRWPNGQRLPSYVGRR